jgi:hypothetical protein
MGDEEDIPGEDLASVIRGQNGAPVADALMGCSFYRDDPDDLATIAQCDRGSGRLSLQFPTGATRVANLASGYVLLTPALRAALEAAITPAQREEKRARASITAYGFTGAIEQQDIDPLLSAIRSAQAGVVPQIDERRPALRLAEKYGAERVVAKLASAWVDADPAKVLPDVLITLLSALRHSGRSSEALARSEILRTPGLGLSPSEERVLFTERAALLADRYEQTRTPEFLAEARKAASRSWANGPSEHCSHVFERLKKLERESKA